MREKRRRLITVILMATVMVLSGFVSSIRTNADPAGYGVWANGTEFSSSVTSIACGEGTATYDNSTKTLTLTNATITGANQDPSENKEFWGWSQIYSTIPDLKIVLSGTNTLNAYDSGFGLSNAITCTSNCNITIDGASGAKLIINGGNNGIIALGYDESTSSVTIKGGVDITMNNVEYTAIIAANGVTIEDSSLTATTTDDYSNGIYLFNGKLKIINSTVNLTAKNNTINLGNSGGEDMGVWISGSKVKLNVTGTGTYEKDGTQDGYGIFIQYYYNHETDKRDNTKTNGEIRIGESTVDITSWNGATNPYASNVIYGTGLSITGGTSITDPGNVIITVTGKMPTDGGSTPTPTPGGDSGSGGSGSAGGNGNAAVTPTPTPTPAQTPDRAKQMGEDGTPLGKGASFEAADSFITNYDSENDPAGTTYSVLQAKALKTTKDSVKVTWKKAPGAVKYYVYASKCGKTLKPKQISSTTGTSYTLKKLDGKKISKGTYYKFVIIAVDSKNDVVSSSKTVHAATMGGKVGNTKKFTTKAKKDKVTLKAKKSFKLKAKQVAEKKKLKIKNHRPVKYESTNTAIATVNAKGEIKGVGKGKCEVYVYAQNGVSKKINVNVK